MHACMHARNRLGRLYNANGAINEAIIAYLNERRATLADRQLAVTRCAINFFLVNVKNKWNFSLNECICVCVSVSWFVHSLCTNHFRLPSNRLLPLAANCQSRIINLGLPSTCAISLMKSQWISLLHFFFILLISGTLVASLSIVMGSQTEYGPGYGCRSFCICFLSAVLQFSTAIFVFGWVWSIMWGIVFIKSKCTSIYFFINLDSKRVSNISIDSLRYGEKRDIHTISLCWTVLVAARHISVGCLLLLDTRVIQCVLLIRHVEGICARSGQHLLAIIDNVMLCTKCVCVVFK